MKHCLTRLISVLVTAAMLFSLTACGAAAPGTENAKETASGTTNTDMTETISETASHGGSNAIYTPQTVDGKAPDEAFRTAYLKLTAALMAAHQKNAKSSTLISPLSIMTALAMVANGADGDTLAEIQTLLGGDIGLDTLNNYLYSYFHSLPSDETARFAAANSIWINDLSSFTVLPSFLQTNANYYPAEVRRTVFNDAAVSDINDWVSKNTDAMIPRILDRLSEDDRMILINALVFDAKWNTIFFEEAVQDHEFTALSGQKQTVPMMSGSEYWYLWDENTAGFMKPYRDDTYRFVALLPEEGTDLNEYIASLSAEKLNGLLQSASNEKVSILLPKFSYDDNWRMETDLAALGMPAAFCALADFSRISEDTQLYIDTVIHKTHIEVAEEGTRAAAVTMIGLKNTGMPMQPPKEVILDRPFVYMIIDTETQLPIFIGAVTEIAE